MKKLSLVSAVASALFLGACGGGGGGSSESGASNSPSSLSGTASKGILSDALVEAFLFENGQPALTGSPVASGMTDENGDYSITIPAQHQSKPVYIRISSTEDTEMKCDIAGGCDADGDPSTTGDITPFGGSFPLAEGELEMSAVVPQALENIAVNVTPLTTVSAELAIEAIQNDASEEEISVAIAVSNSQVSTTFGLGADITQIPVVDLTDTTDVEANAGSNDAALNYAAINAAIVSAKQADTTGALSIGDAITQFADDVVQDGGLIANALNDEDTSLEDIFAAAIDVLDEVENSVSDAIQEDALDQDLADAQSEPETSEGELDAPSDTSGVLANYDKVKAFVEELRELGVAIEGSVVEGSDETVGSILTGFEDQLNAAEVLSSEEVEQAMELLGDSIDVLFDVYQSEVDEIGVDDIEVGTYISDTAVEVLVTEVSGNKVLSVSNVSSFVVGNEIVPGNVSISATINELDFTENLVQSPSNEFDAQFLSGRFGFWFDGFSGESYEFHDYYLDFSQNGTGQQTDWFADEVIDMFSWSVLDGVLSLSFDSGAFISLEIIEDNFFSAGTVLVTEVEEAEERVFEGRWYRRGERIESSLEGDYSLSINLDVNGSATVGGIDVEFDRGVFELFLEATVDEFVGEELIELGESVNVDQKSNAYDIEHISFEIDANIVQNPNSGVQDPISFEGDIAVGLSGFDLLHEADHEGYPRSDEYILNTLGIVNFSVNGEVENTSGESFRLGIGLDIDASEVPNFSLQHTQYWRIDNNYWERIDEYESSGGETEDAYADVSLQLSFDAELAGVTDALDVDFNLTRTGYDDVEATLDLSYPGRDLELVANVEGLDSDEGAQGSLTLTNVNDGIVVFVDAEEAANDDEFSVEIRMDTNADGVVDENDLLFAEKVERNGIELLQYINEDDPDNIEFESLF